MWYGTMLLAASLHAALPPVIPVVPVIASSDSVSIRIVAAKPTIPPAVLTTSAPADATRTNTGGRRDTHASTGGAPDAHATSWSSRFDYTRHGIFVRVALDGTDAGWFLLDTGANATVIDTRVARSRHLESVGEETVEGTAGTTRATVYELGNVSVNGAIAIAVTGVAQDLSGFPSPDGAQLAGILGSDFLGAYAVRIDFATHEVTFSGVAADSTAPGRARIHFDVDHGTPRIPVTLDGHVAADFRIDTGLHGAYEAAPYLAVTDDVWQGLERGHSRQITDGQVRVRGLGDDDVVRPMVRIGRMTIGSAALASPWIVPQARRGYFARDDAVSLLGNGVLERFSPVTIDYLAGTLYLTMPG